MEMHQPARRLRPRRGQPVSGNYVVAAIAHLSWCGRNVVDRLHLISRNIARDLEWNVCVAKIIPQKIYIAALASGDFQEDSSSLLCPRIADYRICNIVEFHGRHIAIRPGLSSGEVIELEILDVFHIEGALPLIEGRLLPVDFDVLECDVPGPADAQRMDGSIEWG